MRQFDVVIIGGGAAGLIAAGVAAGMGKRVLLCEKMEKTARKVRITGKGRCNLTNMRSPEEFLSKVRSGSEFFAYSLGEFSNRDTVAFFEKIGVPLTIERGERVFPTSSKAWDIADGLTAWALKQGVEILCNTKVAKIETADGKVTGVEIQTKAGSKDSGAGFLASRDSAASGVASAATGGDKGRVASAASGGDKGSNKGGSGGDTLRSITCDNVIVATGGVSYPSTGSTGDGYNFAYQLGHDIEPVRPSLVPLESEDPFIKGLGRLSLKNVSVSLLVDSEVVATEFGELEFNSSGISGPVILRMSRQAVDAIIDQRQVKIAIDLKPALSAEKLSARIDREIDELKASNRSGKAVGDLMRKLMPAVLINPFLRKVALQPNMSVMQLTGEQRQKIVKTLKNIYLPISDYRPFEEAIVTAGGVDCEQVDAQTMQSKLVQGLYFAGEVLDIDADTGGYNLQIAFSTGHLAGKLKK